MSALQQCLDFCPVRPFSLSARHQDYVQLMHTCMLLPHPDPYAGAPFERACNSTRRWMTDAMCIHEKRDLFALVCPVPPSLFTRTASRSTAPSDSGVAYTEDTILGARILTMEYIDETWLGVRFPTLEYTDDTGLKVSVRTLEYTDESGLSGNGLSSEHNVVSGDKGTGEGGVGGLSLAAVAAPLVACLC